MDGLEALLADVALQALQLQKVVQAEGLTYKGMFVQYIFQTHLQIFEKKVNASFHSKIKL